MALYFFVLVLFVFCSQCVFGDRRVREDFDTLMCIFTFTNAPIARDILLFCCLYVYVCYIGRRCVLPCFSGGVLLSLPVLGSVLCCLLCWFGGVRTKSYKWWGDVFARWVHGSDCCLLRGRCSLD